MSLHYNGCLWRKDGLDACDLNGPKARLCEACLTYLLKQERPPNWSPRVSAPGVKKP